MALFNIRTVSLITLALAIVALAKARKHDSSPETDCRDESLLLTHGLKNGFREKVAAAVATKACPRGESLGSLAFRQPFFSLTPWAETMKKGKAAADDK